MKLSVFNTQAPAFILICLVAAPALGSPTRHRLMRSTRGEELADNMVVQEDQMSEESEGNEGEVKTAENLEDVETAENQIVSEELDDVESAEDLQQKTEVEAEDLMAEDLKDEAEDEVKEETEDTSKDTPIKPQTGSRYGNSSYGNRHSNVRGSSSFSHGGFGGHRFSNPGFSGNFGSGSNFRRNIFGSGNGRTSFHHQTFGLSI